MATSASDGALPFDHDLDSSRLDVDYNARATVPEEVFERIIGLYGARSAEAADAFMLREGVVFDESGERFDLLGPQGARGVPAVIFIHGGYWRALSRFESRFPALSLAPQGVHTIVPDYSLAPAVSLTEIVRQVRALLAHVWREAEALGIDRERIVVTGSSAGGHLAAMLAVGGWQGDFGLPSSPVAAAMPVSGLFDVGPLARTHPQEWLKLTDAETVALSPMRHVPPSGPPMVVALAEHEADGFRRQSAAFSERWSAAGGEARNLVIPDRNHFDVILDLCDANTTLSRTLLALAQG